MSLKVLRQPQRWHGLADDLSAVCDTVARNDCMTIISQPSQGCSQHDESETEAQQKEISVLGRKCRQQTRELHKLDIGCGRVNISRNLATYHDRPSGKRATNCYERGPLFIIIQQYSWTPVMMVQFAAVQSSSHHHDQLSFSQLGANLADAAMKLIVMFLLNLHDNQNNTCITILSLISQVDCDFICFVTDPKM